MTIAISIGAYRLCDFVRLNVLRCRRIFPDAPVLISDDKSDESPKMKRLAEELQCDYVCPPKRRSHFSGDLQAILNGLVFAQEIGADVLLKISQRVIPIHEQFRTVLEKAFENTECQFCLPDRLNPHQITRPGSKFYAKFGLLTDLVAIRPETLDPGELLEAYRGRCKLADGKRRPLSDSFAETSIGHLLATKFQGPKHRLIKEWSVHEEGKPKLVLRKATATEADYRQIALQEGITDGNWDLREWIQIEGRGQYRARATVV